MPAGKKISIVPYDNWEPPNVPAEEPLVIHRQNALLTQRQLAHRAAISPVTVANLENGVPHEPTLGTMLRVANALGIHPLQIAEFKQHWLERREVLRKQALGRLEQSSDA